MGVYKLKQCLSSKFVFPSNLTELRKALESSLSFLLALSEFKRINYFLFFVHSHAEKLNAAIKTLERN